MVAAALALAPFYDTVAKEIPQSDEAIATFVGLVLQTAAAVGALVFVARSKGLGSPARDFGLRLGLTDIAWVPAGLVLGGVATALLAPIIELGDIDQESQDVRRIFNDATNLDLALLIVGVLVIAPVGEELLFRGALLRGLVRRVPVWPAIFISAMAFALIHVVLDVGTGFGVPALLLLGLVSGWRAIQTLRLGQSIALHCGFNLLVVLAELSGV